MESLRLDVACVKLGLVESRNKAAELIAKNKVCINGVVCDKAAFKVSVQDNISLLESSFFVSRAAEKLQGFLEQNPKIIDLIKDKDALDIGASAGGFSQVLLQNGAKSVVCVDVGSGQLHKTLRQDCRVEVCENTDIREFAKSGAKFKIVVCDVSFIALKDILDSIKCVSVGLLILLFKPQFEVGIFAKRNKKGVVKDSNKIKESLENAKEMLKNDFRILCVAESLVKGKCGNAEFFIACERF